GGDLLVDRLVAGDFLRPAMLLRGLQLRRPALCCWRVDLLMGFSGLLVEPLAWLQLWLLDRQLQKAALPDDPIVVIGHWRSGTTYLHQLLACDPTLAMARNALTMAPQVALLLKPWFCWALKVWMTRQRPIDAVLWGPDDPQEDELGLARLTIDTNMVGMAFPLAYPWFFRRNVLGLSGAFERQWLHFTKLTWLHDGKGKTGLPIKNSAHSARVELVLRHCPRARFVLLRRNRQASIRSLVQVKQRLGSLVGLQPLPDAVTQVEETVAQARSYTADPVTLPLAAEQRLNDLMEEA
ncbi:sulfotransferase, partial [Parasynechococcus sp.]|uniref:sulfotransferase n=1 Tax=Parasynechococcus sp. TaxID=3101203 RepID=UPI003703F683